MAFPLTESDSDSDIAKKWVQNLFLSDVAFALSKQSITLEFGGDTNWASVLTRGVNVYVSKEKVGMRKNYELKEFEKKTDCSATEINGTHLLSMSQSQR